MSEIVVRRVQFPFSRKTPRYWNGGDPFLTHFMNALSSTFPEGEAFFIRSVRHYRDQIDDPNLLEEIRGFSGQEGHHTHEHLEHVALLTEQGYGGLENLNRFEGRETRFYNRHLPLASLAVTVALEHLTAVLARQLLTRPEVWIGRMHPDMAPFWQWHALEEAEHKAVAFDVLQRVSGSYALRVAALLGSTLALALDNWVRVSYLLYRDGLFWKPGVWLRGLRSLWGRGGLLRGTGRDYLAGYRRDFHPSEIDDRALIEPMSAQLAAGGFTSA